MKTVTKLDLYQVDAFTNTLFKGNPAAVIFSSPLPHDVMQKIALENNLSETAFISEDGGNYNIKWFSPLMEIDLCGHVGARDLEFSSASDGIGASRAQGQPL